MIKRVALLALLLVMSFPLAAKIRFSEQLLETDFKITHPVLSADLLGEDNKQIVLFGENEQKQRLLAVYQLSPATTEEPTPHYQKVIQVVIPSHFLAYDLLKTSHGEKLLFQANDCIFEFLPAEQSFHRLTESPSIYLRADAQYLAKRNFTQDINGDELDDIVVPDFRQVHLYLQNADATFTHQAIAVQPKISLDAESATYTATPLYFSDLNQDSKLDLILVRDGSLEFFQQNPDGSFNTQSASLPLPIDIKAMNWWEIRESDGQSMDQNALSYRTLSEIKDLNNDKIADLLVRFSQTEGVLDRQNNYEVYLGRLVDGKISYAAQPDSVLRADGTTIAVKTLDIDGDNKMEILLLSLDIGVSQIIGALLSGSIDQDVYLFKMDSDDKYYEKPQVEREVELSFSLSSGKSGEPVVQVADFDGDGLKDLMYSDGKKTLKVYQGTTKKELFEKRSARHKVALPKDGDFVETQDLNKDGKDDVIIRYGRQDDTALGNKLVILFSS